MFTILGLENWLHLASFFEISFPIRIMFYVKRFFCPLEQDFAFHFPISKLPLRSGLLAFNLVQVLKRW